MQQYQINRYKSRGKDKDFPPGLCELCGYRVIADIHHTQSSFRAKRDSDAIHLIGLCRECHTMIHQHNTHETREKLDKIIQDKILTK